jgi:hypothetical protein
MRHDLGDLLRRVMVFERKGSLVDNLNIDMSKWSMQVYIWSGSAVSVHEVGGSSSRSLDCIVCRPSRDCTNLQTNTRSMYLLVSPQLLIQHARMRLKWCSHFSRENIFPKRLLSWLGHVPSKGVSNVVHIFPFYLPSLSTTQVWSSSARTKSSTSAPCTKATNNGHRISKSTIQSRSNASITDPSSKQRLHT